MFFVQGLKRGQPIREDSRQLEKTHGMPGRSSVDYNVLIRAAVDNFAQVEQRHHLVHSRECESQEFIYFVLAEEGASLEDFGDDTAIAVLEILERRGGVKSGGMGCGRGISRHHLRAMPNGRSEAIGKRMRGVGRYEVDPIISSCPVKEGDCRGTRRGSLADAALADEEKDLLLKELRQ